MQAYDHDIILEKLPSQIGLPLESIACYGDNLLIGTKQGHLLVYSITPCVAPDAETTFSVKLERFLKAFSKKGITQITVIPEFHIIITLSDGLVSVHDLTVFSPITSISRTKGASLFTTYLETTKSMSGEEQHALKMCVSVKRKLMLFYWKNRDFEYQSDINVSDTPSSLAWLNDSLCIGFKTGYYLVKLNEPSMPLTELFPTGKNQESLVMRLDDSRFVVRRDQMSLFIGTDGKPTQNYAVTWSEIPSQIVYQPPYLVAVLPKYVEVRTIEPRLQIQSIELTKPKIMCHGSNQIYVASSDTVWRLSSRPITAQIKQLLQNNEFKLALQLAEMTDEPTDVKQKNINYIKNLYAFVLFTQQQFKESLEIFAALGTDPSHVIGLFPNLLPQEFRKQLKYPDKLPDLHGSDLERGILALIDYLREKHKDLVKSNCKDMSPSAMVEGSTTIRSRQQLIQIIDTMLLKCYLMTNDGLVAPWIRVEGVNCHLEESVQILIKKQKYAELVILYETKNEHKAALKMMLNQACLPGSPLKGPEFTMEYLQKRGPEHIDLIFEYATWVLKEYPNDALRIFTEDLSEVEALPRQQVLQYLETTAPNQVIPYLEHVILNWEDSTEQFHNSLPIKYKDLIIKLQDETQQNQETVEPESEYYYLPDDSPQVAEVRHRLIFFLRTSTIYMPDKLLAHLPNEGFYEERAILLGKLGRHVQALAIYVYLFKDNHMAEEYCKTHYNADDPKCQDVYLHLLQMFLFPASPLSLGLPNKPNIFCKPQIDEGIQLLKSHANNINTCKALEMLPQSTKVTDILGFLENVIEETAAKKRSLQILRSLAYAENLQVQEQHMFYQKPKCVVREENICHKCKRRIGNSVFVRYPQDGSIVHYSCYKEAGSTND